MILYFIYMLEELRDCRCSLVYMGLEEPDREWCTEKQNLERIVYKINICTQLTVGNWNGP